mgnify:CR=1 FL=1|tara:strand:- start:1226 stop:1492 length:267 start_codon:yes stop_codon:yes gene_type:complete
MVTNNLRVTTIRPFTTTKKVEGKKVSYRGIELIAYTPTNNKIKLESNLVFELPLVDDDKQTEALVKDVYEQLLVEDKKLDLFYKQIKN